MNFNNLGSNVAPPPMGAPTPMGAPQPIGAPSGPVISLQKGQKIDLSKTAPDLKHVMVGLGWDANDRVGAQFDLDASCFLLDDRGMAYGIENFIFYNNLVGGGGAVQHQGDNLTGDGDGDDEQIYIDLEKMPANIAKVAIAITIDQADTRKQNFGMVRNAFARLVDNDTGAEKIRFDLGEDFSTETAIVAVELYRHNGTWKLNAVAQGYAGGLAALARSYGLNVG